MVYGLSIAMLFGAWLEGRRLSRPLPVDDIALDKLPRQLGPWRCKEAEYYTKYKTTEARFYTMTFVNEEGEEVDLIASVTRSRLGALRDWSLASQGQGWVISEEGTREFSVAGGLPFPIKASAQTLSRMGAKMLVLNWYVSPTGQSSKFARAELMGWRDRLLNRNVPWGQLYVVSSPKKDTTQEDWEKIQDLFVRMAPHFYAVLRSAARG